MISDITNTTKSKSDIKESLFLITINTNKSVKSCDEQCLDRLPTLKENFTRLAKELFEKKNIEKLLIELISKRGEPMQTIAPAPKEYILGITREVQLEVGEKMGFLHLHALINIKHKKKILFNLPVLKKAIYKFLEKDLTFEVKGKLVFKKPYVAVHARHNHEYSMKEYVNSDVTTEKIIDD